MEMKDFECVPAGGTLYLEKVLFEFDKISMITVCKNDKGKRYLCLCTDVIIQETWMITQITNALLIDLIKDKISILEAYRLSKHPVIIGVRECGQLAYTEYTFDELPEDELLDENEKLENPNLESYLQLLEQGEAVESEKQFWIYSRKIDFYAGM